MTSVVHVLPAVAVLHRGCIKIFTGTWRDWVMKARPILHVSMPSRYWSVSEETTHLKGSEIRSRLLFEGLMNEPHPLRGTSKYFLYTESYIKAGLCVLRIRPWFSRISPKWDSDYAWWNRLDDSRIFCYVMDKFAKLVPPVVAAVNVVCEVKPQKGSFGSGIVVIQQPSCFRHQLLFSEEFNLRNTSGMGPSINLLKRERLPVNQDYKRSIQGRNKW